MTPAEMNAELLRLSRNIDKGLEELRYQTGAYAEAERDYRKRRAEEWVKCAGEGTAASREAKVDGATADDRYARDLAEGSRRAALEAVRARQAQLSALQSLMSAHRAEAEFTRTGGG